MSIYLQNPHRMPVGIRKDGRVALSNGGLWCVVLWEDGTASIHAKLKTPTTVEAWSAAVRDANWDVDAAGDRMAKEYDGRSGYWPMQWPKDVPRPAVKK